MHLCYRIRPGLDLRNTAGALAAKVDTRANGGFVADWSRDYPPSGEIVDAPQALIDRLRSLKRESKLIDVDFTPRKIEKGKRDNYLTSFAGRLRRAGSSPKEILAALRERNAEICDPPLPDKDLVRISNSVGRYLTEGEREPLGAQPSPIIWSSLEGIDPPPRTWWIKDWLGPWPTLTSGMGGVGKTRLWQAISASLSADKRYFGTSSAGACAS